MQRIIGLLNPVYCLLFQTEHTISENGLDSILSWKGGKIPIHYGPLLKQVLMNGLVLDNTPYYWMPLHLFTCREKDFKLPKQW